MTIERITPMKICGSVPTMLIRRAYMEGGEDSALACASEVLIGFTDEQVLAIGRGEAIIVGNTVDDDIRLEWVDR